MSFKYLIFSFVLITSPLALLGQVQTIKLGEPTTHDYVDKGIKSFTKKPTTSVSIPKEWEKNELFYLVVFYTFKTSEDPKMDIVVEKKTDGELLHIDLDNDEIITKDQQSYFFPYTKKRFEFWITDPTDPKQKTGRLLLRLPSEVIGESIKKEKFIKSNFDSDGSLNSYWINYWRRHNPAFDGSKGSFYFTERLNLRRGKLTHPQGTTMIGLVDYSVNGLYNDDDDRVYLDLNNNGKLSYYERSEIFGLEDTLTVGNNNFIVTDIEKYGNYMQVKRIDNNPTAHPFLTFSHKEINNSIQASASGRLKSPFFKMKFNSIEGELVNISDYDTEFLLINFWGEWCGPCIAEISELKKLRSGNGKKIKILSFLKAANYPKAEEIIESENLSWNHIEVSENIEHDFRILMYPTNYLINLEEKTFYQFGKLDYEVILKLIKEN
ncbi:TlpA family protein disulfide reductase [Fodinibius salsisoli]|uniref:Redoxin domain-containing protein n=1 Tax=Fodinibius salsisoli TaxID=2820877 RepID=A0ABT3PST7_9BACT|nr:redoxin domain-containing protein [Fodinibius salsisoli]MCW9708920.1 redoxin domain-containing protein [Fodinibius salsisoli]